MKSLLRNEDTLLSADDVLLVPQKGILASRRDATLNPFIYSAPMDRVTGYWLTKRMLELNEIPVVSRFLSKEERARCLRDFHSTEAFFAVGGTPEHLQDFIKELEEVPVSNEKDFFVNVAIDIAHGHSVLGLNAIRFLRKELTFIKSIMSGSIASSSAGRHCFDSGATHLRVGIGSGAACTTRIVTGIGVPQLEAVYNVANHNPKAIVIADGGIKNSGDAVKYLAAGAKGIMMGHEFSKTFEAPGWEVDNSYQGGLLICGPQAEAMPQVYKKVYRGQASAEFQKDYKGQASWCPEGASSKDMYWDGETVETLIMRYREGVQSAISYLGLVTLADLHPDNVTFIRITSAGRRESLDHMNLK
jgi:IMP dehydrogenase/GMP reductase